MENNYTNLDLLRSLAVLSAVALQLWRACIEFHICAENPGVTQFLHNLSFTGYEKVESKQRFPLSHTP